MCADGFGKGVGNTCHSCENGVSRVLIAVGVLFFLSILLLLFLAVVFLVGGMDAVGGIRRSVATSMSASMNRSNAWTRSGRGSITVRNSGTESLPLPITEVAPAFNLSSEHREGDNGVVVVALSGQEGGEEEEDKDDAESSVKSPDTAVGLGLELLGATGGVEEGTGSGRLSACRSEHGAPRETASDGGGEKGGGCCRCGLGEKIKRLASRVPLDKLKILVVVWQILTVFPSITAVDYPPSYQRFLSWIDFVNLDLGSIFSASCVFPAVNFYDRLLITTLLPIGLLGVLAVTYHAAKGRAGIGTAGVMKRRAAWSRHMAAGLLLTFLVSGGVQWGGGMFFFFFLLRRCCIGCVCGVFLYVYMPFFFFVVFPLCVLFALLPRVYMYEVYFLREGGCGVVVAV